MAAPKNYVIKVSLNNNKTELEVSNRNLKMVKPPTTVKWVLPASEDLLFDDEMPSPLAWIEPSLTGIKPWSKTQVAPDGKSITVTFRRKSPVPMVYQLTAVYCGNLLVSTITGFGSVPVAPLPAGYIKSTPGQTPAIKN